MDPAIEPPRLGPIEVLQRLCGEYLLSGKQIVQMPQITLDFSSVRLVLKLLYIDI